jgi:hypothetical protein
MYRMLVAYWDDLDPLRAHDAMTVLAFGHCLLSDALTGCGPSS